MTEQPIPENTPVEVLIVTEDIDPYTRQKQVTTICRVTYTSKDGIARVIDPSDVTHWRPFVGVEG